VALAAWGGQRNKVPVQEAFSLSRGGVGWGDGYILHLPQIDNRHEGGVVQVLVFEVDFRVLDVAVRIHF